MGYFCYNPRNKLEGNMRRLLILLLMLSAGLCALGGEVLSVTATDLRENSSRVSIMLSECSSYRAQPLPGGKGIRIVLPGVTGMRAEPRFSDSSQTIESIKAYSDGASGIIEVRTRMQLPISHMVTDNCEQIILAVNYPPGEDRLLSDPSKEQVRKAPSRKRRTPSLSKATSKKPAPVDSLIAVLGTDTLFATSEPEPEPLPAARRRGPYFYYLLGLAVFLLLGLGVVLYFSLRRGSHSYIPVYQEPVREVREEISPALARIVARLHAQGWTEAEIARETKLDEQTVRHTLKERQRSNDGV